MKSKEFVALALIIAGTNVFTFATTRYWTTDHVLTRAEARVTEVIRQKLDGVEKPGQSFESRIEMAVGMAGGMYHWWNSAILYWGLGGVLIVSGLLTTKLEEKAEEKG